MIVKCQYCDIKNTERSDMEVLTKETAKGKIVKKYYHHECLETYLEEQKQREIDKKELDRLDKVIKETFNVLMLPNQVYIRLASIRNGVRDVNSNDRQKAGYSYAEIADSFIRCKSDIEYYLGIKHFDSFMQAFNYSCQIIISELNQYTREMQEAEAQKAMAENIMDVSDDYFEYIEEEPRKTKKKQSTAGRFFEDDL